jgi:hypothetical protein
VHACPDDALLSTPVASLLQAETANWGFFQQLPQR